MKVQYRSARESFTDSAGILWRLRPWGSQSWLREAFEGQERVWAGTVKIVGPDRHRILTGVRELLEDPSSYATMAQAKNAYGDSTAAQLIVEIITDIL